jgi:hypothetical protein
MYKIAGREVPSPYENKAHESTKDSRVEQLEQYNQEGDLERGPPASYVVYEVMHVC